MSTHGTFRGLQSEVGAWHSLNFPAATPTQIILKAVEEVAELAAAHNRLLDCPGPNGGVTEAQIDAIGDVTIVLAALCAKWRLDYAQVVEGVWGHVKRRSAERIHRPSTVADSLREAQP